MGGWDGISLWSWIFLKFHLTSSWEPHKISGLIHLNVNENSNVHYRCSLKWHLAVIEVFILNQFTPVHAFPAKMLC